MTKDEITIKGVRIPKGMTIGVPIYALQNDAEVWPDPEKFDPERQVYPPSAFDLTFTMDYDLYFISGYH